jgi:hypothetical protein
MIRLRSTVVRLGVLLVLSASIALVMAGTSAAATFRVSISGSSTQTVSGDPGPSSVQVSAESDVGGANASGTVVADTYKDNTPGSLTTFHGDVSQGCLLVQGNQAIAVGLLPPSEQFSVQTGGGPRLIEWSLAVMEDNGAVGATPVDRAATGLLFDTSGPRFCNGTVSFSNIVSQWLGTSGPVDSGDYSFSYGDTLDNNPSQPDTNLTIVDSAGLPITVTDEPDPAGLDVSVGGTSGTAVLDTCGGFVVDVTAGTDAHITCGSVIVQVVQGAATVVLDSGETVAVPPGGTAEVSGNASAGYTVQNEGSTPITVTVDGTQATVAPGQTSSVGGADWSFLGFSPPVRALPALNPVKAGSTVAFKWRLLDASGAPVTNLALAILTVTTRDCTTGATTGSPHTAPIVGGLQNLSNGYYQLNWKTSAAYAGTCQTSHLDVGGGITHDAAFRFKS